MYVNSSPGGNESTFGKVTSSTITGSLPWSYGHMSPLIQKPFSTKTYIKFIFTHKPSFESIYIQ